MIAQTDYNLFDLLKVDEATGTIHLEHRRMLLLDAYAMGLLRKELIETVGHDLARRVLMRLGYACGYRAALMTKNWQSTDHLDEWWATGAKLHGLEGIVHVQMLRSHIDKAGNLFDVEAEWRNSYEAEQHRTHLGIADSPVCWMLTGYASGYSSAVFGQEVFYHETECLGKGDARCLVIGWAANQLDEQVHTFQTDDEGEHVHAELRYLLETLDHHERDLKQQRDRVSALESQLVALREAIRISAGADELVGTSTAFRKVMKDVERVAPSETTVLLSGETGTGKDMVARVLHARSRRSEQPLITVNCAALPVSLAESELFGYEKGAFTGAFQRKLGRFEIAHGGTIFLDEVGELPLEIQAKFLRILQQGEFERVGGTKTIRVDVRVLAATNQPLDQLVVEGKFRADLFYRLNSFPIHLPPLRERPDDIMVLACYFAQRYSERFKKAISSINEPTLERLRQYHWPGNVREMEHMIERAILLAENTLLTVDVPHSEYPPSPALPSDKVKPSSLITLDQLERSYIKEVLRHTNGLIAGRGGAAEILGLPASTLRHRMTKLGLRKTASA
ncbi:MAG: sigma 54-interacting transcriptional regulator [Nitrospira sp.]